MNRRTSTAYFLSLAAAGALTMGACSQVADTTEPTAPPEPTITEYFPTDPGITETPSPTPTTADTVSLGGTATFDTGVAVTITPAGEGADYAGRAYTNYTVSVTNGTATNFDPTGVDLTVNYGAAGTPATQVFDLSVNPTPYFQGVILPGGSQTITQSYDVPTGEPVVISVRPDYMSEPAIFTG